MESRCVINLLPYQTKGVQPEMLIRQEEEIVKLTTMVKMITNYIFRHETLIYYCLQ